MDKFHVTKIKISSMKNVSFAVYQKWGLGCIVITTGFIFPLYYNSRENIQGEVVEGKIKLSIFSNNAIIYMESSAVPTSNQEFSVFWHPSQVFQKENDQQNLMLGSQVL